MKPHARTARSLSLIVATCSVLLGWEVAHALSYNVSAWTSSHPGGPGDISGSFQPLKDFGLLAVVSTSSDFTSSGGIEASADAAAFGSDSSIGACTVCEGRGIEPMAHVAAATVYNDPQYLGDEPATASASMRVWHRIRLTDDAPGRDLIVAIPMFLHYHIHTSGGTGALTSASFTVAAPGLPSLFSRTAVNGQEFRGTLRFNSSAFDMIEIGASAGASARYEDVYNEERKMTERHGVGASAVADPFLFVDPSWEYARYVIVEQESGLRPGEWVPVTRAWDPSFGAVPEPATALLLGAGLLGLVAVMRRGAGRRHTP